MSWLVDLILKLVGLFANRTPPVIGEAEKAGAAEARATAQEEAYDTVEMAAAAARAAWADADGPGGLRAPDPDCRD